MEPMFLVHEKLIFMVFLLNILDKELFLGKFLSISHRNSFPNLVAMATLKGEF